MSTSGVANTSNTFATVVVDAGHGGTDSGALRRYAAREKMVTLDVAHRLDEYRELLGDRIAEAVVEQRYGAGVYRPSPSNRRSRKAVG